ncbi:MAG: hypothetical protein Q7S58_12805 [Candidatus Binatus sp.]|uniref:hypothetical protein n=1 Tax=Candidatus Binatus sp. TaxID=2811406 RepID=UPI00272832A3|nr:hypothetical protein [Candidatus Binatus sp.]MDO8433279.1 hypothetical protein [Candidatus Binatus sp.]
MENKFTYGEVVLESANGHHRYKLFITDEGRLAAVRLFPEPLEGSWKSKGMPKILAWTGPDGIAH